MDQIASLKSVVVGGIFPKIIDTNVSKIRIIDQHRNKGD